MGQKVAIFPGSFDPFTRGHEDIVKRSLLLFDKVIIAIGHNNQKKRYFDLEIMKECIREAFQNQDNIEVVSYNELTADLADRHEAQFLIRGLRNTTDFEYENSISQINKYLKQGLETIFLITSPDLAPISSTIIREVHKYDGDVSPFLPYNLDKFSLR